MAVSFSLLSLGPSCRAGEGTRRDSRHAPTLIYSIAACLVVSVAGEFWVTRNSIPDSRVGVAVMASGQKVYAVGGQSYESEISAYDMASDTWETKNSHPQECLFPAYGAQEGGARIYLFSSVDTGGSNGGNSHAYMAATDAWMTLNTMPTVKTR